MESDDGVGGARQRMEGEARAREMEQESDEIHDLRKLIVGMMQTEMELVERVRQNEENIAAVNERVDDYKELIRVEQTRRNTIRGQLSAITAELGNLESKKMVVDSKHRQLVDMIAQQNDDASELKVRHGRLRRYIQNIELHIERSKAVSDNLLLLTNQLDEQRERVIHETVREDQLTELNSALKMTQAKKQHIEIAIIDMERNSAILASEHRQKLKDLEAVTQDFAELVATSRAFERDCVQRRTQVVEETIRLRHDLEQLNKKLKAKQKKYRTKTKAEIGTLKKRVAFLARELELHQMEVEDILSSVTPFRDQHGELQMRKMALEDQVSQLEAQISSCSDQIDQFDALEDRYDTSEMQAELEKKNTEMEQAVKTLSCAKDKLIQLEREYTQIQAEKDILERVIGELSSKDLGDQVAKESDCIKALQIECQKLAETESRVTESNIALVAQNQQQQKINKRLKAASTKLRKELQKLLKSDEQLTAQLEQEEHNLMLIAQAEEQARQLEDELNTTKQANSSKLRALAMEFQEKETEWKQKCLDEETRLKAELVEWTLKAQALQEQLEQA